MGEYIIRRVASMIPVLLIASVISFGLLYILPGDPAVAVLGDNAGNQATYQALRHDFGLDEPIYVQYGKWLGRVAHGNLGTSIRTNEPVTTILLRRLPVSLYVGFVGLLIGIAIGLTAAIVSALRPGSRLDIGASVFALGGIALPSFWQALIFVYVFAVLLHWLPPSGYTSPFVN
ncbi:MAG: ABC transporter permease, partial [Thermomicrobia bacterium]|nr:ABC transporter permease [Thermomicrobia bacterium]MCA1724411.1 ABC transporter permease [Thermomicrobia bacterium]